MNKQEKGVRYLLCEAPEGRVPRKRYRTPFSRSAFTLIELLLVMTVISMASLMAVVAIKQSRLLLNTIQESNVHWTARHQLALELRRDLRGESRSTGTSQMPELRGANALVMHRQPSDILYEIQEDHVLRTMGPRKDLFRIGVLGTWWLDHDAHKVQLKTDRFSIVVVFLSIKQQEPR